MSYPGDRPWLVKRLHYLKLLDEARAAGKTDQMTRMSAHLKAYYPGPPGRQGEEVEKKE